MHASASISYFAPASAMQETGQAPAHAPQAIQASVMEYAIFITVPFS